MTQNIVLTSGIYDLIKEHIRKRKVTRTEEEILELELKHAKQVIRKELPEDVVSINKRVTVKDLSTDQEEVYSFVAPDKAKQKKKTQSILSDMGIALVGYRQGTVVKWPFREREKELEIVKVELMD